MPLERMLRLYFLQQWFALTDEALEDAVYDSLAFRGFLGIDMLQSSVPDATTLPKFRRLLEANDLGQALLERVNAGLKALGPWPAAQPRHARRRHHRRRPLLDQERQAAARP